MQTRGCLFRHPFCYSDRWQYRTTRCLCCFHHQTTSLSNRLLFAQPGFSDKMVAGEFVSGRSRRSFISNSKVYAMKIRLLIAFMLLVFSSNAFAAGFVDYTLNGETYQGYYISPTANAPLVLLVHDWDGLTDYEVKRAEMLAAMGYAVFAADLFGKGIRPTEVKDKKQHTGELYKDRNKLRSLMLGAMQAAKAQGGNVDSAVVMGYCFGGAAVLEMARSGAEAKGFVTFHGGLGTPEGQDYAQTKGKLLILHGSADSNITLDDFGSLAKQLEQHNVAHEMITYSGAPHAFTVFHDKRYREDADRKSWRRFGEFLAATLQ